MKCSGCGRDNSAAHRFCGECDVSSILGCRAVNEVARPGSGLLRCNVSNRATAQYQGTPSLQYVYTAALNAPLAAK